MPITHGEPNELKPGEWVKRGLTRVYVESGWDHGEWIFHTIEKNMRRVPFVDLTPVTGPTCDDCGCLLANTTERCPACLVWAELDAARWSWRALGIGNYDTEMEAA